MQRTVDHAAEEFTELIAELVPGATDEQLADLARSVVRTAVGALFDPSLSSRQLRASLRALIEGTALAVRSREAMPAASPAA